MTSQIRLTTELSNRISKHKKEYGYKKGEDLLEDLLDIQEVSDAETLHIIHQLIRHRISKGINLAFISEMRMLYTYLGHILQRLRAL